jgi:hypothetical protein
VAVPPAMLAYAREAGIRPYGLFGEDFACEGSDYHTPTPLLLHRYRVQADGSLAEGALGVMLCATCADNLRILLNLLWSSEGTLPWEVRREFGNKIRQLGMHAWQEAVSG